jgi:deoxyribonuclease V
MLRVRFRHRWNLSPSAAVALQEHLAGRVEECALERPPKLVAGADCAFTADGARIIAGWAVWDVQRQCIVETATATRRTNFPYVPGLLSFREAPALLWAARKLSSDPDVLLFDGHGRAHPRRFGIACHMGLLLDLPSVGCAKSRLCGEHKEPSAARGSHVPLIDRGTKIGRVLRTRHGLKPVYVSVGHRITIDAAIRVVLACCTKYRLPEPARLAHQLVTLAKEERQ